MFETEISGTILYYPTIALPSGKWLRQALLYWDEIGSIVPQDWDDVPLKEYTPEVQRLREANVFRPFRPDLFIRQDWNKIHKF